MGYSSRGGRRGFRDRLLAAALCGLLLGGSIAGVASGAASVVPVTAGTQLTAATDQAEESGEEAVVARQLGRHHHRHHQHRRHHHRHHHHRRHHRHHNHRRHHRHHHRWYRHHHHRHHHRHHRHHHRWYRHRWYRHRWYRHHHHWYRHWYRQHHRWQILAARRARERAFARRLIHSPLQFSCFAHVIEHESSWNPRARNRSSGAYGLPQALPARKLASAGGDWRTNPRTQIRWAIHYMDHRYGSACTAWHFWRHHHWY